MATKEKELTVAQKLKNLYDLQAIDSKIDQISVLKGELPIEVSDLEDEIVGLETRVAKLTGSADEQKEIISKHDANIKEAEALIKKYDKQLKSVKNNREYDALTKELEMQKLEIQLSEKRSREATANIDSKKDALDSTKEKLKSTKKNLDEKKVELSKILEKTEKEEASLKRKSEKAKKVIEDRLLKGYEKIRESYRNGLAVVHVARRACGGCFNQIPPQLQLEITQRKKIIVCEHCGRVLVDDDIENVKTK